jgi:hypothetical protein
VDDVTSMIWALEREFWLGGADVYRRHLADEALMVFPGMVLTKPQTVDAIANGRRWTSVSFADQRLVRFTRDTVALIYRASGSRAGQEPPYSALISSVYVMRDDEWRLALHQQSPLDSAA